MTHSEDRTRSALRLLGWRPLQVVVVVAALVIGAPLARSRIDPFGFGMVSGGISIDTDGAEGEISDGQLRLNLPLTVSNRTANVVVGISMWTEAWACPSAFTPRTRCRRILSVGQEFVPRLMPDAAATFPTVLVSGLPLGVHDGDAVRIERRVENIFDERDAAREAAHAAMR